MTDDRALLASVRAAPADDAPRLVYADWLDEHAGDVPCGRCHGTGSNGVTYLYRTGKEATTVKQKLENGCTECSSTGRVPSGNAELAKFIRWQCANRRSVATARYGDLYGTLNWTPFMSQVPEDLFEWFCGHVGKTFRDLDGTVRTDGRTLTWHRGFVARVSMPADDAFAHLGRLLADWPITTVVLTAPLSLNNLTTLQDRVLAMGPDDRREFLSQMVVAELPLPQRLLSVGRKHFLNLLYPGVRFRERFPRGYRMPEGFRTTIAFSQRPAVNIWDTGAS